MDTVNKILNEMLKLSKEGNDVYFEKSDDDVIYMVNENFYLKTL